MPASQIHIFRIALVFLIPVLTASCGSMEQQTLAAAQAQNTNVTVPDGTTTDPSDSTAKTPIDTSLDQDIRTRHMEEKITRLEKRLALLENHSDLQAPKSAAPKQAYPKQAYTTSTAKPYTYTPPSPSSTKDIDPVTLYNKARALLLERNIAKARILFSNFVKKFPGHDLADNALYWLGECSYTTGEYEKAVEIFKSLVRIYPKGQKVPDALLKTGYAYISMDDVSQANLYLKQVITRYPFSPAADKAQHTLSQTQ